MSFWKRTMDYLGLGPDDAYDDYDIEEEYEPAPRGRRQPEPEMRSRGHRDDTSGEGVVRTLPNRPTFPSRDFDPSQARRGSDRDDSGVQARPKSGGGRGGASDWNRAAAGAAIAGAIIEGLVGGGRGGGGRRTQKCHRRRDGSLHCGGN